MTIGVPSLTRRWNNDRASSSLAPSPLSSEPTCTSSRLLSRSESAEKRPRAANTDRFQDGGLADAVLSGKQGHAAEAGNSQLVDPSESLDGQVRKVERLAHGVLHRQATLYHFVPRVSGVSFPSSCPVVGGSRPGKGVGRGRTGCRVVAGGLAEDSGAQQGSSFRTRLARADVLRGASRVSRIASAISCTAARKGRRRLSSPAITAIGGLGCSVAKRLSAVTRAVRPC